MRSPFALALATAAIVAACHRDAREPARVLALAGAESIFRGVLVDEHGVPIAGGSVELTVEKDVPTDPHVTRTDAAGRFALRLESGSYTAKARAGAQATETIRVHVPGDSGLGLRLFRAPVAHEAPSAAELDFVAAKGRDCQPGTAEDPWSGELLSRVSVVGLGEQTHGSREGNAVRFALARSLVERHGFGVVALEAGYAETLALDAWVAGGEGDGRAALAALQTWIWMNEETREFVRWARASNQQRRGAVRIVGLDMQSRAALEQALAATTESGALALQEHLAQCAAQEQPGEAGGAARDRALADNVVGLLDAHGGTKVVVLAHDHHVARERLGSSQHAPMGEHLAARLGGGYLAVGFLLGTGTFRAQELDPRTGASSDLEELRFEPIGRGSMEDVFARGMKTPGCALVPLRGWPGGPRIMRVIGASYAPGYEAHYRHPVVLARAFDAAAFVTHSTAGALLGR